MLPSRARPGRNRTATPAIGTQPPCARTTIPPGIANGIYIHSTPSSRTYGWRQQAKSTWNGLPMASR
eukprot:172908-Lingulodinium_polyedra.AAC.1